jgi:DNA-binding NarL/FixJ family response regulator
MAEERATVLILGDSALVSLGLRHVFETIPEFLVQYAAQDAASLSYIEEYGAVVAILDAHVPTEAHVAKVRELKAGQPDLSVVVVTAAQGPQPLGALVLAGADAILDVSVTPEALVEVVRLLRRRVRFVTTYALWPSILENLTGQRAPEDDRIASLTPREREVYEFLRDGRTDREIADSLTLSLWTVKHHVGSILQKLELRSRREVLRV